MSCYWDFLGGPEVETLSSNAGDVDSIPDLGAKISNALGPKKNKKKQKPQNIKWKQYCKKFNKDKIFFLIK